MEKQLQNYQYYEMIAETIKFLSNNKAQHPSLSQLSTYIGLSEYHLQHAFSEWAGVSSNQFLQYFANEYTKEKLKKKTVVESALSCEMSSASRLYDLMVSCERITPDEYQNSGEELTIEYGSTDSLFGKCFLAITHRGICKLAFYDTAFEKNIIEMQLHDKWQNARIIHNESKIKSQASMIFTAKKDWKKSFKLLLKGTPFQLKVWEALLSIPENDLVAYQDIAVAVGKPKAVRAVASAIAQNNIAYLIPCHRVIRQNGDFGQYRWNKYRKQALIAWEASISEK